MRRRGILVLLSILASSRLYAQHETILIKSSKRVATDRVVLYGDLDGQRVALQCMLAREYCKELARGEYNIERLLEGEGSYKGCSNVDLYRVGEDSFKEEPLGEYCLLERK